MKIAILGAGFTGLSAAYHLTKKGHDVTVFEKEKFVGGLAVGYKEKNWQWSLEAHYHHFFTNDFELINLAKELNIPLIFPKSQTSLYFENKVYPFNTPMQVLSFSPLPFFDRLRLGIATVICKITPQTLGQSLEKLTAFEFAKNLFGENVYKIIWKPLLESKFNEYAEKVNASWLWARIKKRTLQLGYVEGGFQVIAEKLAEKIKEKEGKIFLNTEIIKVDYINDKMSLRAAEGVRSNLKEDRHAKSDLARDDTYLFDKVISTLPTSIFLKLIPDISFPVISHLHAINLVVETDQPILKDIYWLNINDTNFPFLCVVQHTNFIDKINYGGKHLCYIGNYLPENHPYFKKTPEQIFQIYKPYLDKLSIKYQVLSIKQFVGFNAQPVFEKNYSKIRPYGKTTIPNLFFANLDSVYPWDRGTNYALELGHRVANLI